MKVDVIPEPVDTENVYLAGVIDGEGCFVSTIDKRTGKPNCWLAVEMTDLDVIQRLHKQYGGHYHENTAPSRKPHFKQSWRWRLNKQKDLFDCIIHIGPYLCERRYKKASELFEILEPKVCK
jgi:hypothetical protein